MRAILFLLALAWGQAWGDVGLGTSDPYCSHPPDPFPVPAPVEALYVADDSGSYGLADGSSCANAFDGFASILWGAGAGKVSAGDILYLCGNFSGEALTIGAAIGTAAAPVQITSADPNNPSVVDGAGTVGNLINNGSGARPYYKIYNIEVKNSTTAGLNTAGAGPVWIENIVAHDNGTRGIYLLNQSNATVRFSTAYSNANEGIRESTSGTGTSTRNTIECNATYGNPTQGIRASSVSLTYPVTYGVVRYNDSYDNGDGIYLIEATGYRVYGNNTHDNTDTSSSGEGYGVAFQACTDCWAFSNFMVDNRYNGIESWGNNATPQSKIRIFGNFLSGNNPTSVLSQCQIDINNGESGAVSGGSDVLVFGNVAIGACALILDHDISGQMAFNNTLIGTSESTDLSTLFIAAGAHDTTLWNNFVTSAGNEYAFWSSDTGVTGTFVHQYNSYYREGGGTVIRAASTNYTAPSSWEATALAESPVSAMLFGGSSVTTADGACLKPSSPLLGAGTYIGAYVTGYANEDLGMPPAIGARGTCYGRALTTTRAVTPGRAEVTP